MRLRELIPIFHKLRGVVRLLLIVALLIVLTKAHAWQFLSGQTPLWDFDVYHQTARDVWSGLSPYQVPYMQTAGPPLVIAPYVPLASFSLSLGRSLMTVVNMWAGGMACYLLARSLVGQWRVELCLLLQLLLWISFPARFSLLLGQPNLVLLLAVTIVLLRKSKQPASIGAAALALASTVIIKTNFVMLWISVLRQQPKLAILAAGGVLSVALLLSPLLKPQFYQEYRARTPYYTSAAVMLPDVDYYNQSLRSTLGRLGEGTLAPAAFAAVAILGMAYLLSVGDPAQGILLSLLLSPIVWQHYIVVIYPVVVLLAAKLVVRKSWWWLTFLAVCMLLLAVEFPRLHGAPLGDWRSIWASHYFFGLLGLLAASAFSNASSAPSKQW